MSPRQPCRSTGRLCFASFPGRFPALAFYVPSLVHRSDGTNYVGCPRSNFPGSLSTPLWNSRLAKSDIEGLGFEDLIELRFVHTFRDEGVSLQIIRRTLEIVFDPARKFGQPILTDYDVPTAAVADAVTAEAGSQKRMAKLYGIPLADVRKAVEFEARVA